MTLFPVVRQRRHERHGMRTLEFAPRRISLLMVLLAFPLVVVAGQTPKANEPVLYQDAFVKVISPDKLSVQEAKAAAKKVMAAWEFDLKLMRWSNPKEITRPFTLRVISDERMQQESGSSRAFATINRFNVRMSVFHDPGAGLTFAHELGHLQAARALGKYDAPRIFAEGHGLMMNQLYADHIGYDRHKGGTAQVRVVMKMTADEAKALLTDDGYRHIGTPAERERKGEYMECLGFYFVEYLRSRKGITDAVPMMGRVFEQMGQGKTFEQAFAQTYGVSYNKVVSELVAHFKRTEANPAERVKGTRLEEYLPVS